MSVVVPRDVSDACGQGRETHQVCACKRPKGAALGPSSSNCDCEKETLRNFEDSGLSNGEKHLDASVRCGDCTLVR